MVTFIIGTDTGVGKTYYGKQLIKKEYFEKTDLTTFCGWKGMANYYSVTVNGKTNKDCAWYYAEPSDAWLGRVSWPGIMAFSGKKGSNLPKSACCVQNREFIVFQARDIIVITSYSIHYTKLYEERRRPGRGGGLGRPRGSFRSPSVTAP